MSSSSSLPPVHVLGRFPPPFDGETLATERCASLLAPRFAVRRHNTQTPDPKHAQERPFSLERLRHYIRLRARLRAALAEAPEAPVLWHAISPTPLGHWRDVIGTLPAFGPRQPVYAVMHRATFERLFRSPLTARSARRLVTRVDGFVFLSRRLAEACAEEIPPEKWTLIPNTIDDAVACSAVEVAARQAAHQERHRAPGRPLRLLFASNMIVSKGYLDVLGAGSRLAARGVPFELDFVGGWGSGAERARFERYVREHDLSDRVRYHGSVHDRKRIKAIHLAADVFLLPTAYPVETQPKAIIEALNAGTPVVASRRGIIEDMVREGQSAHLVPTHDPDAIAEAVERLRDPAHWLRLSQGARSQFEEAFSPEVVGQQWAALAERAAREKQAVRTGAT